MEPSFREPMLATLVDDPQVGDDWWFERKLDGIRLIAVRDGDRVRLWSRNGLDRSASYPELVEALAAQRYDRFVVDGEVVAFDGDQTSFSLLQQRSGLRQASQALGRGVDVFYYVFDLLHLDGVDLEPFALSRRNALLTDAFVWADPLRLSAHTRGDAATLQHQACAEGWEGLIAKRDDSPYTAGRSRAWLKLKCVKEQEVVIGGWTDPKGSRLGLGSLLVGYHEGGELAFAGKVGTGFDDTALRSLLADLRPLERPTSPFDRGDPPAAGAHWVEPRLVCQVGFSEWTTAGRLRHPRYLGRRDDKDPAEVVREVPS